MANEIVHVLVLIERQVHIMEADLFRCARVPTAASASA
jgi:hypothetical protein